MANVVTITNQGSVQAVSPVLIAAIDTTTAADVFVPCGFDPSVVKATKLNSTTVVVSDWNVAMGGKFLNTTAAALAFVATVPFTVVEQGDVRGLLFDGTSFLATQDGGVQLEIWR